MAQDERTRDSDLVIDEALPESGYCNDEGTVVYNNAAVVGSLLQTSSGEFVLCATGAKCAAILRSVVDTTSTDDTGVLLARGPAVVNYNAIDFSTLSTSEKADAVTALAALGVEVRPELTEDTL